MTNDVGPQKTLERDPSLQICLRVCQLGERAQTEARQLLVRGRSWVAEACEASGLQAVLQRRLPAHHEAPRVGAEAAFLALLSTSRPLGDFKLLGE